MQTVAIDSSYHRAQRETTNLQTSCIFSQWFVCSVLAKPGHSGIDLDLGNKAKDRVGVRN